jgi:hypothetical protein
MGVLLLERQDQNDDDGEQNRKITHNRNLQMRTDRASNPRRPLALMIISDRVMSPARTSPLAETFKDYPERHMKSIGGLIRKYQNLIKEL